MNKALEKLKELRYRITNFNGKFHDYKEIMWTIESALEALKVIEEKEVNIHLIKIAITYKGYNWLIGKKKHKLTKDEFDLVKDVL